MPDITPAQQKLVEQADRVQAMLLNDFEAILKPDKNGMTAASPTDRATIARYLKDNNFRVDANNLPQNLAEMVAATRAKRPMPDASKLPGE
jgi:hypothetical protein